MKLARSWRSQIERTPAPLMYRVQCEFPYNDIGVYLVWLDRADEAIPWLRKAIRAKRYCCYQFPHFTLGQILLNKGKILEARRLFERALKYDPDYLPAKEALEAISKSWL